MSLVSGVLTDKLGVRTTTFIGGAMATLGMFLSSIVYRQVRSIATLGISFAIVYRQVRAMATLAMLLSSIV